VKRLRHGGDNKKPKPGKKESNKVEKSKQDVAPIPLNAIPKKEKHN